MALATWPRTRDLVANAIEMHGGRGRVNSRGHASSRGKRSGGRGHGRGRGRATSSPTPKPRVGDTVSVVEKANYGTDLRTVGTVSRLLTRAPQHPRGFKVMLSDGTVGRCTELLERGAPPPPQQQRRPQKSESDEYLESLLVPPPPGIRLRDWEERQSRQRAPPPQMRARPMRTPRPYTLWLSAGLSDAERAAAAAAVEAIAGSSAVGSLAPFAHSRRSMLIEGAP